MKKLEGKYGDGIVKRGGKGKILDNHNEICYSYEYKSSCELYLHIICGCFLCLSIMKKADNHRTTLVVRCMSAENVKINLGGMEMKNVNWKELFIDILVDIVAGMIIAVGIYNFALNADFPVAGFSGIAIILYHIFGLPVGAGTIILNVPVAIFCYKF